VSVSEQEVWLTNCQVCLSVCLSVCLQCSHAHISQRVLNCGHIAPDLTLLASWVELSLEDELSLWALADPGRGREPRVFSTRCYAERGIAMAIKPSVCLSACVTDIEVYGHSLGDLLSSFCFCLILALSQLFGRLQLCFTLCFSYCIYHSWWIKIFNIAI